MSVDQDLSKVKPQVYPSKINVPYSWWAGDTAARFFAGLSEKRIEATRCECCNKVFAPPRKTCPECFAACQTWVDLALTGTVTGFTVARAARAAMGGRKLPAVFALVKLDGADTALLHVIGGCAPGDVRIGMRVKARFAEEPAGGILDILYFEPV